MNAAVLKIMIYLFFGYIPKSWIAESYNSSISFKGVFILIFILAISIYIPADNAKDFPLLHNFIKIVISFFFPNHPY